MKTKNMTTLDLRNWKRRSEPMKTTKLIRTRGLLMIVAAASFVAVTVNAAPGNLFEADFGSGRILEFTPNGTQSTFASALNEPQALATQPQPQPSFAAHIQQPINAD